MSGGAKKFKQVYWEGIGLSLPPAESPPVESQSDTSAGSNMAASNLSLLTILGGMCMVLLAWSA
jgi:hypothetical protein